MSSSFAVDVSQAGEGQLEIMVNRGMVKNSVRSLGKGLFTVSFVPRDSRPHLVDILFNGEPIPRASSHLTHTHTHTHTHTRLTAPFPGLPR